MTIQATRYCETCEQDVTEPCSSVNCSTPEIRQWAAKPSQPAPAMQENEEQCWNCDQMGFFPIGDLRPGCGARIRGSHEPAPAVQQTDKEIGAAVFSLPVRTELVARWALSCDDIRWLLTRFATAQPSPADAEKRNLCGTCHGAGAVSTGIAEASDWLCWICDGDGYQPDAQPSAAPGAAAEITLPSGSQAIEPVWDKETS